METEAVRSNERAENVECKFIDIEDELKVIILYGLLPSPAWTSFILYNLVFFPIHILFAIYITLNVIQLFISSLPHAYVDDDHGYFDGQVVGQNQQTLEVGEEKSLEREDVLLKQIKELMNKLKLADTRSENSEMDISRLNIRIDKVEEDLITEKAKIKQVSDDLNAVFDDLM